MNYCIICFTHSTGPQVSIVGRFESMDEAASALLNFQGDCLIIHCSEIPKYFASSIAKAFQSEISVTEESHASC